MRCTKCFNNAVSGYREHLAGVKSGTIDKDLVYAPLPIIAWDAPESLLAKHGGKQSWVCDCIPGTKCPQGLRCEDGTPFLHIVDTNGHWLHPMSVLHCGTCWRHQEGPHVTSKSHRSQLAKQRVVDLRDDTDAAPTWHRRVRGAMASMGSATPYVFPMDDANHTFGAEEALGCVDWDVVPDAAKGNASKMTSEDMRRIKMVLLSPAAATAFQSLEEKLGDDELTLAEFEAAAQGELRKMSDVMRSSKKRDHDALFGAVVPLALAFKNHVRYHHTDQPRTASPASVAITKQLVEALDEVIAANKSAPHLDVYTSDGLEHLRQQLLALEASLNLMGSAKYAKSWFKRVKNLLLFKPFLILFRRSSSTTHAAAPNAQHGADGDASDGSHLDGDGLDMRKPAAAPAHTPSPG
eukprot:CAMPEP_0185806690 /NCGR_PEP_ID=MMETSP1322-20130828/4574_1 /TAXON_ID=265543 /ORGANISM="Minutocellus polymorphus, Strain RCC2270" /LENGTH=407 /DNA_ID=CAMNT_0028502783 /DNA_START=64 /DNA_END=1283 /DNA_ORIENTATION=+